MIFLISGVNKPGIQRFGNHNYWFSWQDPALANQKWDWFNARNYCRKRCMDLVSFETEQEYNWVKGFMNGTSSCFEYLQAHFNIFHTNGKFNIL